MKRRYGLKVGVVCALTSLLLFLLSFPFPTALLLLFAFWIPLTWIIYYVPFLDKVFNVLPQFGPINYSGGSLLGHVSFSDAFYLSILWFAIGSLLGLFYSKIRNRNHTQQL